MNFIVAALIFCIVLFIYLHIFFQLKTSNDLEIYEIEQPSKDTMEEICDLKQPVVFDFNNASLNETCNLNSITNNYGAFDVKVRNLKNKDDQNELYIPITLNAINQLFSNDTENKYITENNQEFLEETGLIKCYKYNDAFLRPYMVSECEYDLMTASDQTTTPFKYDINYRNFYLITQGSVKVKLAPPKSKKYLYSINDYENFEFSSPINPWNIQHQYRPDFDKIKCLEIVLKPGSVLFIPSFWWYTFQFTEKTSLCTFKYRTYMNTVANVPKFIMKILQSQNVKRNVVKKFDNSKHTLIGTKQPEPENTSHAQTQSTQEKQEPQQETSDFSHIEGLENNNIIN
jgi:hypothetical protein